jgi:hypothetical protein
MRGSRGTLARTNIVMMDVLVTESAPTGIATASKAGPANFAQF